MSQLPVYKVQFHQRTDDKWSMPETTEASMEGLCRLIQSYLPMENVTVEDISIIDSGSEITRGVKSVCFRGAVIASVIETTQYDPDDQIPLSNLCLEVYQPGDYQTHEVPFADETIEGGSKLNHIEEHVDIANEVSVLPLRYKAYQLNTKKWIDDVLNAMKQHPELVTYVDSIPDELLKIGDTHVVVPHPEHMTEDMIDASRSLLLYTDTFSTNDIERIRERITMRPWTRDNIPDWFKEDRGHLTKAGRAMLAYHLTTMAALNPPKPQEKYFPETRPQPLEKASKLGFELTLFHEDHELSISRLYESIWKKVTHGDMLDIQINRHQLPEYWRALFKKNAIEISGRIRKTPEDSEVDLENVNIRLGLKTEYVDHVTSRFIGAKRIPQK